MDTIEHASRAWLHRRGKKTWMFYPSTVYGELVHITNNGTVYAILAGHKYGKPFWIGKLVTHDAGYTSWITVESELRARSIEFEYGGDYVFPGQLDELLPRRWQAD